MTQKMKITQDALYKYLTEHDVKLARLAELMDLSAPIITSCFKHHKNVHGTPRTFSVENIQKLNEALPKLSRELQHCLMTFGTDKMYTNKHGRTYDPGMIEPMNRLGELLNMTGITGRLLGWSKSKKAMVFGAPSSKNFGNISEDDVTIINSEVLAIAGVLNGIEVVPDDNAFDGSSQSTSSSSAE